MTTTAALLAAVMAAGTLGVLDYAAVPLLVAFFARLGIIDMPASMSWVEATPTIVAGASLFGLSIISARHQRPPRLKLIERSVGLPFAAASVAAVALASASHAGLQGNLLSGHDASAALNTHNYSGSDVTVLAMTALVGAPMAGIGKATRVITSRFPAAKSIQAIVAGAGVGASALLMRMPSEVRIFVAAALVVVFFALLVGIARRATRLLAWWRHEARTVTPRQRLAVGVEAIAPGMGCMVLGNPYRGVPRLALTGALLLLVVAFGIFALPLFLFVSLGKALSLADEASTTLPPGDDDVHRDPVRSGGSARSKRGPLFGRPSPQPAILQARSDDMEW